MDRRKLRNCLIKRSLQMRITYNILLLTLLFSFISGCSIFVLAWPLLSDFVPTPLLHNIQVKITASIFIIGVLLICSSIGASLFMMHRIAGAIYHIEQHLDALLQKQQPPPLQLRPHDELQEIASKLNALTQAYDNRVGSSSTTKPRISEKSTTQL